MTYFGRDANIIMNSRLRHSARWARLLGAVGIVCLLAFAGFAVFTQMQEGTTAARKAETEARCAQILACVVYGQSGGRLPPSLDMVSAQMPQDLRERLDGWLYCGAGVPFPSDHIVLVSPPEQDGSRVIALARSGGIGRLLPSEVATAIQLENASRQPVGLPRIALDAPEKSGSAPQPTTGGGNRPDAERGARQAAPPGTTPTTNTASS